MFKVRILWGKPNKYFLKKAIYAFPIILYMPVPHLGQTDLAALRPFLVTTS